MIKIKSLRVTPEQRFMVKVNQEINGCWRWLGCFDGDPRSGDNPRGQYGRFALDGYHMISAHRASYLLFRGPIGEGLQVCHKCDVPACVNPMHLFLGTIQENMDDQCAKGRAAWQKPGWISPRKGTGKYLIVDGVGVVKVQCIICNKDTHQKVQKYRQKKSPVCGMACKSIVISWSAYTKRNTR